jgi:hypothetical protein
MSCARRVVSGVAPAVRRARSEHEDSEAFTAWLDDYFGEKTAGFIRSTFLDATHAFVAAVMREAVVEVGGETSAVSDEDARRCALESLASFALEATQRLRREIGNADSVDAHLASWEDGGADAMARALLSRAGAAAAVRAVALCPANEGEQRAIAVL